MPRARGASSVFDADRAVGPCRSPRTAGSGRTENMSADDWRRTCRPGSRRCVASPPSHLLGCRNWCPCRPCNNRRPAGGCRGIRNATIGRRRGRLSTFGTSPAAIGSSQKLILPLPAATARGERRPRLSELRLAAAGRGAERVACRRVRSAPRLPSAGGTSTGSACRLRIERHLQGEGDAGVSRLIAS